MKKLIKKIKDKILKIIKNRKESKDRKRKMKRRKNKDPFGGDMYTLWSVATS